MAKLSGTWLMVMAMSLSGTIGLFVVTAGASISSVVFVRGLIGGATLLGWLCCRNRWKKMDVSAAAWILLGSGALVSNWACLFAAYRLSNISIATVVYHVQPFFLVLMAAVANRRLPGRGELGWLLVAFVGVVVATGVDLHGSNQSLLSGVALALLAALLYAVATLATRRLPDFQPAQIAGLQLIVGAALAAPFVAVSTTRIDPSSIPGLLILGFVHTGVLYALMYGAFQRLPIARIALLSFIYPVVAMVVDRAYFHTTLSPLQMLGSSLVLIALLGNQLGLKRKVARGLAHQK